MAKSKLPECRIEPSCGCVVLLSCPLHIAATDLLAALKEQLEWNNVESTTPLREINDRARAAIAKATGTK